MSEKANEKIDPFVWVEPKPEEKYRQFMEWYGRAVDSLPRFELDMRYLINSYVHAATEPLCNQIIAVMSHPSLDLVTLAVARERDRCVKLAEDQIRSASDTLARLANDESWRFAMDEMSGEVNEGFGNALDTFKSIADKIRSGE